jgi:hypothetical protein
LFELFLTNEAGNQLNGLKNDKGLEKRYNAVKKAFRFLSENPRHRGLNTHEFTGLQGPGGKKVFEAYAEKPTPAAYRSFWHYGPAKNQITILAITPHPEINFIPQGASIPFSILLIISSGLINSIFPDH